MTERVNFISGIRSKEETSLFFVDIPFDVFLIHFEIIWEFIFASILLFLVLSHKSIHLRGIISVSSVQDLKRASPKFSIRFSSVLRHAGNNLNQARVQKSAKGRFELIFCHYFLRLLNLLFTILLNSSYKGLQGGFDFQKCPLLHFMHEPALKLPDSGVYVYAFQSQ